MPFRFASASSLLLYAPIGLQFVCIVCFCFVLMHAFGRGLGTGLLVLLIPFYNVYYAFFQFEHRFRGWIVAGFVGCGLAAIGLRLLLYVQPA